MPPQAHAMWRHILARVIAAACAVFRCRALRECAITPADPRPFAQLLSPRDVTCPAHRRPWELWWSLAAYVTPAATRGRIPGQQRVTAVPAVDLRGSAGRGGDELPRRPATTGVLRSAPTGASQFRSGFLADGKANESDRAIGAGYRCRKRSAHRAAAIVVDRARAARMIASRVAVSTER